MGRARPTDPARWDAAARSASPTTACATRCCIAIAPTATIASIAGCYECIEPQVSNLFKRETLSGEFLQINRYLVRDLQAPRPVGRGDDLATIKKAEGSVQDIDEIPAELKAIYRTAWEIPMRSLIDMAADRGAFIDQSQSLNLFMEIADHRQAQLDVPPRLEGGPEDHVLPALPPGDAHQPDHHGGDAPAPTPPTASVTPAADRHVGREHEDVHRRRGDRLLAREPRSLRGVRLTWR